MPIVLHTLTQFRNGAIQQIRVSNFVVIEEREDMSVLMCH